MKCVHFKSVIVLIIHRKGDYAVSQALVILKLGNIVRSEYLKLVPHRTQEGFLFFFLLCSSAALIIAVDVLQVDSNM